MEAITIGELLSIIKDAGIVGLLMIILVGGAKSWWVFGWAYRLMTQDRDMWRTLALSGTDLAKRGLRLAERNLGGSDEPLA